MKVTNNVGFEFFLNEALKVTAKMDFGSFGEYLADRNRMSEELLEEIEKNEPVETLRTEQFMSAGDFLEMSISMQKN